MKKNLAQKNGHQELDSEYPDLIYSPQTSQSFSVEDISPEIAIAYLESQERNRDLNNKIVRRYADEMLFGSWMFTPQPLIFQARNGKKILIDGQHRLAAVKLSGTTQKFVVAITDRECQEYLDLGYRRSLTHKAQMKGLYLSSNHLSILRASFWKLDEYKTLQIPKNVDLLWLGQKYKNEMSLADSRTKEKPPLRAAHVRSPILRYLASKPEPYLVKRTIRWLEVVQTGLPNSSKDWAASLFRQELDYFRDRKTNKRDRWHLLRLGYSSLLNFLEEKSIKKLDPIDYQPWENEDFDV